MINLHLDRCNNYWLQLEVMSPYLEYLRICCQYMFSQVVLAICVHELLLTLLDLVSVTHRIGESLTVKV